VNKSKHLNDYCHQLEQKMYNKKLVIFIVRNEFKQDWYRL